jgi:hypothetical protein
MSELFFLFAASMTLAAFLTAISIWSHRKLWAKVSAVLATALFIPTVYLSYADLLSRPKPASLEWWHREATEATVVGSKLREGVAIYLWIELADAGEPRAYRLPWQQELAKQLYGAQREAEANGTKVLRAASAAATAEDGGATERALFPALQHPFNARRRRRELIAAARSPRPLPAPG